MLDFAIVGGGPAGLTAGLYAARAGLKVAIFEELFAGGQAAATEIMENIIAWPEGISGVDFATRLTEQAEKWGAEIRYDAVTGMDLEGSVKLLHTDEGDVEAKTVLLCMGSKPRPLALTVPGEKELTGRGVSYCATCDGALYKDKDVAVVGGGDTALRDVVYLARTCQHVTLIHRRQEFSANAPLQKAVAKLTNVTFLLDSLVDAICGTNKVEGVTIKNIHTGELQTVAVSGVFIAIGSMANSAVAGEAMATDAAGYIVTDEDMHTNIPGVFAAGDIRQKRVRQVVTAAADGAIAAHSAERYLTETEK